MTEKLQKKVERAIKLIQIAAKKNEPLEVSYSGGKDSDVILELAKIAGVKYRAIYKNTTIDPPGTLKHCIEKGVEILRPEISFLKLIEKKGMPTRRARYCCEKLKEYKVLDTSIQGIRISESVARAKRYHIEDPIICRVYGSKKNQVNVVLPILSWTNEDVEEFIKERNIKCHPLYYDKKRNFHAERRLGCIGCPLKSDAGCLDYKTYPKLFRAVVKAVCVWWKNHPNASSVKKFGTPYGLIAHNLFFKSYKDWQAVDNGIFGKINWKLALETYFDIKL